MGYNYSLGELYSRINDLSNRIQNETYSSGTAKENEIRMAKEHLDRAEEYRKKAELMKLRRDESAELDKEVESLRNKANEEYRAAEYHYEQAVAKVPEPSYSY
jgi:hypothetical protein